MNFEDINTYILYCIYGVTFFISIFILIGLLFEYKDQPKLSFIVNIQLCLICLIHSFSLFFSIKSVQIEAFISPLSDISKISIALIILLIGHLIFVFSICFIEISSHFDFYVTIIQIWSPVLTK